MNSRQGMSAAVRSLACDVAYAAPLGQVSGTGASGRSYRGAIVHAVTANDSANGRASACLRILDSLALSSDFSGRVRTIFKQLSHQDEEQRHQEDRECRGGQRAADHAGADGNA